MRESPLYYSHFEKKPVYATRHRKKMSLVGPCFESETHWECPSNHLQCYRDCCLRGLSFCNHKERRCQKCQTRESQCGNVTMPWECDGYCLKRNVSYSITGSSDCVSTYYQYATFALGGVVLLLLMFPIQGCYLKRKQRQASAGHFDKASMTISTDGSSASMIVEDTELETADLSGLHPGHPAASVTADQQSVLMRETSGPSGRMSHSLDETEEKEPLITQTREQPPALSPHPSQPSPLEEEHSQQQHHARCRDARLDQIIPTSDSGTDVIHLHTGLAPNGPHINYFSDN